MTLNYKRFRTAQLAQFARNRNLHVEVRPRQERGCYLRALIDADNDATFRFFDLPAEMRNHVYEHLLRLRDLNHGWKCYPEILATCKQANREAREYLVTGNHSKVHIGLNLVIPIPLFGLPYLERFIFLNGQELHSGSGPVFHWPSVLLDSQHIDISIAFQQGPPLYGLGPPFAPHCAGMVVNRAIYDLYYAIQDVGRKPNVTVRVYVSSGGAKIPNLTLLLSPIAMFDGPKDFELIKVRRRKRQAIRASATAKGQHSCSTDQVKRANDLLKTMRKLEELRLWLQLPLVCIIDEPYGFITMANERLLSSAIDDLEATIDEVFFVQNEARILELVEENRAMAKDWAKRKLKA
ncbi:hypothetical protein D0864_11608 [Hortaea werneckii]|uniref:Uncharacterized protein n=1 Tax=Hortaea werneckii TaxID=91943 RepID=A0A3M7DSL8_HORWE|nr:hypothetical protein D0864_11608 [Hortaea werneckii]